MPETPEQFYERVAGALRTPELETWDTWPFEGTVQPRALEPPVESEKPRHGEDGVDCTRCAKADDEYIWTNDDWRLFGFPRPAGLPVIVLLEPREHYQEPADLPDEVAADLGIMISRLDRAISSVAGVGRVHVLRYGEGGAHLHWWFMGRPARMEQLRSGFAAIWDDVLPPTPDDVWHGNLAAVVAALDA